MERQLVVDKNQNSGLCKNGLCSMRFHSKALVSLYQKVVFLYQELDSLKRQMVKYQNKTLQDFENSQERSDIYTEIGIIQEAIDSIHLIED